MTLIVLSLIFAATLLGSAAAYADADDAKWVAQCVQDKKDAKVTVGQDRSLSPARPRIVQ